MSTTRDQATATIVLRVCVSGNVLLKMFRQANHCKPKQIVLRTIQLFAQLVHERRTWADEIRAQTVVLSDSSLSSFPYVMVIRQYASLSTYNHSIVIIVVFVVFVSAIWLRFRVAVRPMLWPLEIGRAHV